MSTETKITIKVTPNAKKNQIVGFEDDLLKIKIAAVPDKGRANLELIKYLAKELAIPQRDIVIVKGELSRNKMVGIMLPHSEIAKRLSKKWPMEKEHKKMWLQMKFFDETKDVK